MRQTWVPSVQPVGYKNISICILQHSNDIFSSRVPEFLQEVFNLLQTQCYVYNKRRGEGEEQELQVWSGVCVTQMPDIRIYARGADDKISSDSNPKS